MGRDCPQRRSSTQRSRRRLREGSHGDWFGGLRRCRSCRTGVQHSAARAQRGRHRQQAARPHAVGQPAGRGLLDRQSAPSGLALLLGNWESPGGSDPGDRRGAAQSDERGMSRSSLDMGAQGAYLGEFRCHGPARDPQSRRPATIAPPLKASGEAGFRGFAFGDLDACGPNAGRPVLASRSAACAHRGPGVTRQLGGPEAKTSCGVRRRPARPLHPRPGWIITITAPWACGSGAAAGLLAL